MNDRLEKLGSMLAAISCHTSSALVGPPVSLPVGLSAPASESGHRPLQPPMTVDLGNPTTLVWIPPAEQPSRSFVEVHNQDWATTVAATQLSSTPYASANRFAALSSATDDDEQPHWFNGATTNVDGNDLPGNRLKLRTHLNLLNVQLWNLDQINVADHLSFTLNQHLAQAYLLLRK